MPTSGTSIGAGIGSAVGGFGGPPGMALGAGIGGGIGSIWDMLFGGGSKGKTGVTGPQVVTMPQYSFSEPRLRDLSDLYTMMQGQQRKFYEKGELPTGLSTASEAYQKFLSEFQQFYFPDQ